MYTWTYGHEKEAKMDTAATALIKGIDIEEIVEALDSFYCYNLVVFHYSRAVENRLEGQAFFLLGDELEEHAAGPSLEAAKKLADRIGELGGVVTADPTLLVERSPLGAFSMPESSSDVGVILGHVLGQIRTIIGAYGAFLERVRGRDEISHRLVLHLLEEQVRLESEIEAALA
jgi:ferritin-like protein